MVPPPVQFVEWYRSETNTPSLENDGIYGRRVHNHNSFIIHGKAVAFAVKETLVERRKWNLAVTLAKGGEQADTKLHVMSARLPAPLQQWIVRVLVCE
jgi:hypothetical protein